MNTSVSEEPCRVGETVQWLKCLVHKPESLSLDPQHCVRAKHDGGGRGGRIVRLACTHMHCTVHYIGKLSCSIELTEKWALEAGLRLHLHFNPKHACLSVVQDPLSGGGLCSYLWKERHKPKSKTTVPLSRASKSTIPSRCSYAWSMI